MDDRVSYLVDKAWDRFQQMPEDRRLSELYLTKSPGSENEATLLLEAQKDDIVWHLLQAFSRALANIPRSDSNRRYPRLR